jgi:hypothetical protein
MATPAYLVAVDFDRVREFWEGAPPERREVARRVLDRTAALRERQLREFGPPARTTLADSDPRVKILNVTL